jgi:urea transporter
MRAADTPQLTKRSAVPRESTESSEGASTPYLHLRTLPARLRTPLATFLSGYSEILFLRGSLIGAAMLTATLINPQVGLSGILSVMVAYGFARLIGVTEEYLAGGYLTYNTLLVGLAVGNLFALTPLSLLFAGAAGIMTLMLTLMMSNLFSQYLKLPILSLPFVLVSSVAYLASLNYGNLYVNGLYSYAPMATSQLPNWLSGLFTSLGAILFLPDPRIGALFALLILLHSRILFLLALGGFLLGATLSGLLGSTPNHAFLDPSNFNFILIAMTLGGVFLVPSWRSFLVAATAVCVAALLLDAVNVFWSLYGIPAFTLPFNLVTLTFLYVLGMIGFPLVNQVIEATPEKSLDHHQSLRQRFPAAPRILRLPFIGGWTLWQGFNGRWTHQGAQRYACDFLLQVDGCSHSADGSLVEQFYAWRKPVFAPCRGRVAAVVNDVLDNPPGQVNRQQNWGNYLVIDSGFGWHTVIAHFVQGSVRPRIGEWVEAGDPIGLCGNSGYSPQPHIHIHLQTTVLPGASSLPFVFDSHLHQGRFIAYGIPEEGAVIEPFTAETGLQHALSLPLDTLLRYRWYRDGELVREVHLTVKMNPYGETFLDSGHGHLYFNQDGSQFYCYRLEGNDPALALLFRALPRVPLGGEAGMDWQDTLPLQVLQRGWRWHLGSLLKVLLPTLGDSRYSAHWHEAWQIRGSVLHAGKEIPLTARLDPITWFKEIAVGSDRLSAIEEVAD